MEKPSTRTSFSRGRGHSSRVSTYSEYSHTLRRPFAIQVWATETTGTFAVLDVLGARGTWQQGKNWKNATSYCTSCHMNFMTEKISWNLSSTVQHIRVDFLYSFTLDALLAGFRKPCFSFMNLSWWKFSLLRSPGKDWWSHAQLCLVTSGHCGNVAAQLCMQASLDLWLVPFSCRRRALVFPPSQPLAPGWAQSSQYLRVTVYGKGLNATSGLSRRLGTQESANGFQMETMIIHDHWSLIDHYWPLGLCRK